MVQQDPVVLADTFANVTLGRDISEERSGRRWKPCSWRSWRVNESDGIYTPLGEQGNNLSVGQKLLALARCWSIRRKS